MNFASVASAVERIFSTTYRVSPLFHCLVVSDSRSAIIASVSLERAHRLCCFCLSWSSASPRAMRGACPVFCLPRHRAQNSNPPCWFTGRQICPNRGPAPSVVHQPYAPSSGLGVLAWSSSPRLQRGPSRSNVSAV